MFSSLVLNRPPDVLNQCGKSEHQIQQRAGIRNFPHPVHIIASYIVEVAKLGCAALDTSARLYHLQLSQTSGNPSMQAISKFEDDFSALIGAPTDLRPFVCDSSPLTCDVFIVGFNPATTMSADFWQFWNPGEGFDKVAWFEAYKQDRQLKPLKPGKKRRNSVSPSRRVSDLVLEGASPYRCLETNIFSKSTEQAADLATQQRITAPFDFLLANIKPRVIVAHGIDAVEHIRKMNVDAKVIPVAHFPRGWSHKAALELGVKVKNELSLSTTSLLG